MRVRGITLVETLFTMTLVAGTIGATTVLYAFVVIRAGDSVTQYNTYQQTNDLMRVISQTASNAISCKEMTLGSVTALKCTMPDSGTDTDNDGIIDLFQPTGVYKTLQEYYSPGKRIWYFPSTKPLSIGTSGNFWFRAVRNDDLNPTTDSIDTKWSYINGTMPRIYLPGSIVFVSNTTSLCTQIQITIDPTAKPNSQVAGFKGNQAINLPTGVLYKWCYWRGGKG